VFRQPETRIVDEDIEAAEAGNGRADCWTDLRSFVTSTLAVTKECDVPNARRTTSGLRCVW
jgi:hypothetical protein